MRHLTCGLVDKYSGVDDASKSHEHVFHVLLGHGLGQAADVKISIFNGLGARTSIGDLAARRERVEFRIRNG